VQRVTAGDSEEVSSAKKIIPKGETGKAIREAGRDSNNAGSLSPPKPQSRT